MEGDGAVMATGGAGMGSEAPSGPLSVPRPLPAALHRHCRAHTEAGEAPTLLPALPVSCLCRTQVCGFAAQQVILRAILEPAFLMTTNRLLRPNTPGVLSPN